MHYCLSSNRNIRKLLLPGRERTRQNTREQFCHRIVENIIKHALEVEELVEARDRDRLDGLLQDPKASYPAS